jgi:hypothetical protein
MPFRVLDEDLVRVYGDRYDRWTGKTKKGVIQMLYWGDEVEIVKLAENDDPDVTKVRVKVHNYALQKKQDGYIKKKKKKKPLRFRTGAGRHLLETTFVDVQQGDATLVRTPDRKLIVIDGGEQKFLARILASMFPDTTAEKPLDIDALVITHGDADHFSGLFELANARDYADDNHRQIFARVRTYFHNGLVKGPKGDSYKKRFGAFKKVGGVNYATELWSDPRDASHKNESFVKWEQALERMLPADGSGVVDRLEFGDDQAFDQFRPDVDIGVLGPVTEPVDGKRALRFLGGSDGHTINGHSVILRLRHGNVHLLLGGDLNHHAQEHLRHHIDEDPERTLRSEILKVPHHGSHEFEQQFLDDVNPVVSVVSSGDEKVSKEYVHPRANLMAALGRASRGPMPLVFSTELAAFFAYRGYVKPEQHKEDGNLLPKSKRRGGIHAFQRLVFGAVRVRTDGERVLVAVESASSNIKEAYAFKVDTGGNVNMDEFTLI